MRTLQTIAATTLAILVGVVSTLPAATVRYTAAGPADWTATNWIGGVGSNPPVNGDTAHIGSTAAGAAANADVNITTDLTVGSTVSFPSIILGNNPGTNGILTLAGTGSLEVGAVSTGLTVGSTGTGTFHHNGGTLTATIIDIGSSTGTGTVNLNGNDVSVNYFRFGGSGAGSTATLNRGGAKITANTEIEVEGALNTWVVNPSDVFGATASLRADFNGTIDLNGEIGYTVPTLRIGGGTPGNLVHNGGTFNATTLFDVAGGSSVSTAAGDAAKSITARQSSTLTLGADLTITGTANLQETSTYDMTGFDLSVAIFNLNGAGNTISRGGSDNITATTFNVTNSATFTPDLTGPDVDTINNLFHAHTNGTIDIGTGTLSIPSGELRLGQATGSGGNFSRGAGGAIAVNSIYIQGASTFDLLAVDSVTTSITSANDGVINQKASVTTTGGGSVTLTSGAPGGGTYNADPGTTLSTNALNIGSNVAFDVSVFNLGTAAGTASFSGSTGAGNLSVQESGELNGWGASTMTGSLFNSGRIVANGFGTGGNDLDLSSFTSFNAGGTARDNLVGEDHGLYAVDQGRLVMPDVSVSAGASVMVRVGESATGTDTNGIDMVNSTQFEFAQVTNAGSISAQLLAVDHSSVEAELIDPLVVWDFSAEGGLAFTAVDIEIRYDDLLAGLQSINENNLKLLHFDGDDWVDITTSIDTINKIISADGVSSFSQFAVASGFVGPVPEPSSLLMLGLGSLGLMQSARRRRRIRS